MGEFPGNYNKHDFIEASAVRRSSTVSELPVDQILVRKVQGLMTSEAVRNQTSHEREIISPAVYESFDALLASRDRIRDLQLVPHRSDATQAVYEQMTKPTFLNIVEQDYLDGSSLALVRELYASNLPDDVEQYVVWARDDEVPDEQIAEFIARIVQASGLTIDDVILFERSRVTDTDHVRVAISEHRHIHLWMRKRDQKAA